MFTRVLLFYAPVMLGLLLWNSLACLLVFRRRRLDPRRFRYLYYLVVLLMLPGLVCDVGGMSPDAAIMLRAAWLYPGVFFLAALASIALLRRDGFRWWLVPVPLLNLWLAVICPSLVDRSSASASTRSPIAGSAPEYRGDRQARPLRWKPVGQSRPTCCMSPRIG